MKPKVLVTRNLPGKALDTLKEFADVEINLEDRDLTQEEIKARLSDKVGIISVLSNDMNRDVMESAPYLKVISNYAVGYNNIDFETAKKRNIMVTNTPDVLTEATADMTWALLLSIARRINEGDAMIRNGEFDGWTPTMLLGNAVAGKTLGIIGMGRIGQGVARRATGFGMKTLYHNRSRLPEELEKELHAEYVSLEELLQESDYVSLHAPYTPETHHTIGEKELNMMKEQAYLINTSRGALVNEQALAKALSDKRIAGAGLDVFEFEPKVDKGLLDLSNVVMAPHLGSATLEAREEMTELAVGNLINVLKGDQPITPIKEVNSEK